MQTFGHADRKKRRFLLLCIENATQNKLIIFLYFCINEVSKIIESMCFGHSAVVSVVIVRCQTVVTCSLYVDSSQILSQRLPVSEEEQGDLQNKKKKNLLWFLVNTGSDLKIIDWECLHWIYLILVGNEKRILVKTAINLQAAQITGMYYLADGLFASPESVSSWGLLLRTQTFALLGYYVDYFMFCWPCILVQFWVNDQLDAQLRYIKCLLL